MMSGDTTQASLKRKKSPMSARPAKSTRKAKILSYLEALPPEILQPIFFYSRNVELTQTSTTILRKLSSNHTYEEFCKRLLFSHESNSEGAETVSVIESCLRYYHHHTTRGIDDLNTLNAITRLMNSRFFTWTFFHRLLHQHLDGNAWGKDAKSRRQTQFQEVMERTVYDRVDEGLRNLRNFPLDWDLLWIDDVDGRWNVFDALWCAPSISKMNAEVPDKLLEAPFTPDKAILLHLLLHRFGFDLGMPARANLAVEAAILRNAHQLAWILIACMKYTPDFNQLLHVAVVEAGCDPLMVYMILAWHHYLAAGDDAPNTDQPLLKPTVWNWAERERENKNWKGEWLEMSLKRARFVRRRPISPEVYLATDPKQRRKFVQRAFR